MSNLGQEISRKHFPLDLDFLDFDISRKKSKSCYSEIMRKVRQSLEKTT